MKRMQLLAHSLAGRPIIKLSSSCSQARAKTGRPAGLLGDGEWGAQQLLVRCFFPKRARPVHIDATRLRRLAGASGTARAAFQILCVQRARTEPARKTNKHRPDK